MKGLFQELKRRNVWRVAATYAVVAFFTLQAAKLLFPATTLEGLYDKLVVVAFVGFPVALVIAWAFELTPEGVRRTSEATRGLDDGEPAGSGPPLAVGALVGLGLLVAAGVGTWYLLGSAGPTDRSDEVAGSVVDTADSATGSASADSDRPFVAVLPLENLSPDEENRFFAAGIHEEILGQLASVSGLGVYARTTMKQYGGSDRTVAEIGRELGAEAVLEGSVRRVGDRVRITAQLIDPGTRDHLWSETYERTLSPDAIFEIQAEIAERIAVSLETRLTNVERSRIARAPTEDMEAYDAFLRGREHLLELWARVGPRIGLGLQVDSAIIDLHEAVTVDSAFAEAHGLLGYAYALRFAVTREDRWQDSALRAAARAERLRENVIGVPLTRGTLHQTLDSLDRGRSAFRRVLASDPHNVFALVHLSYLGASDGDPREQLGWLLRAVRHDPRNMALVSQLVDVLDRLGFTDAGMAWCRYGLEHDPDNGRLLARRAWLLRDMGRHQEALALIQGSSDERPGMEAYFHLKLDSPERAAELLDRAREQLNERAGMSESVLSDLPNWLAIYRGYAHWRAGREESGRALLRQAADTLRAEVRDGGDPVRMAQLAQAKHALGEAAGARDDLRVASGELGLELLWPLQSPIFEDVRHETWFENLLAEVETRRAGIREKVRAEVLDLYPPGETRGATGTASNPDD